MDVLIVGGGGHVSGAVARAALRRGHQVWTLTRGRRALPEGVRSLVADRGDLEAMAAVVSDEGVKWDLVVDCICYDLADIRQDMQLFQRRADQFVFVSTDFVYDAAHRTFPQSEEASHWATERSSGYGYKKRLCEGELTDGDPSGMDWTIVRPCHIYGPTSELGCLPLHGRDAELIDRMRRGESIRLVGAGHFLQQPILADDLAETIVSIGGNDSARRQVLNAAGPEIIESRQYYQIVADILGVELLVEEVPVRAHLAEHPEAAPFLCHRIYDLSRIEQTGLSLPSTSVEDGLRSHVEGLLCRRGALAYTRS